MRCRTSIIMHVLYGQVIVRYLTHRPLPSTRPNSEFPKVWSRLTLSRASRNEDTRLVGFETCSLDQRVIGVPALLSLEDTIHLLVSESIRCRSTIMWPPFLQPLVQLAFSLS